MHQENSHNHMKLADVEEIEKVFNETFVPASDHDFLPITSNEDSFIDEDPLDNIDSKYTAENNPNNREIFFAHRSAVPDPEEVIKIGKYINGRLYWKFTAEN